MFQILQTSCAGDTSERKESFLLKRGSQASSTCHIYLLKRDNLNLNTVESRKNLKDTQNLLLFLKYGSSKAQVKVQRFCMLLIAPVLCKFSVVGVKSSVVLCTIFWLEPLHALFLGISRTSKECLLPYLLDKTRCTSAMKYISAQSKPYNRIRRTVLILTNGFLKQAIAGMMGAGQRIDYLREKKLRKTIGFFSLETRVREMLEEKNFKIFDLASPSLGQKVDVFVVIRKLRR